MTLPVLIPFSEANKLSHMWNTYPEIFPALYHTPSPLSTSFQSHVPHYRPSIPPPPFNLILIPKHQRTTMSSPLPPSVSPLIPNHETLPHDNLKRSW